MAGDREENHRHVALRWKKGHPEERGFLFDQDGYLDDDGGPLPPPTHLPPLLPHTRRNKRDFQVAREARVHQAQGRRDDRARGTDSSFS